MAELTYLDFDLRISRAAEGYRARGWDAHEREATVQFQLPFSELEIENFWLRIGRPRSRVRKVHASETEATRSFGGRLFEAVFHGELLACFRRSLDEAAGTEAGLRLRLRLAEARDLADLPWEYLYDASLNHFLALSTKTPIVRYLELPKRIQPLAVQPPLTMLVMLASPKDFEALDVEQEWAQLREALGDLKKRGLIDLQRLAGATLPNLQRRLDGGEIHILHFIGHGGFDERTQEGVLIFEQQSGRGCAVTSDKLGVLLHDHTSLRLVFLNACEGARPSEREAFGGIAQNLIHKGIPAVVAMQSQIRDEIGPTLAHEFYGSLANGNPLDAALAEARRTLFLQGSVEWGVPVLYLRARDGRIFDLAGKHVEAGLPATIGHRFMAQLKAARTLLFFAIALVGYLTALIVQQGWLLPGTGPASNQGAKLPNTEAIANTTAGLEENLVKMRINEQDGAILVYVPAGEYSLSDAISGESEWSPRIYLNSQWIGMQPVTVEQYERYLGTAADENRLDTLASIDQRLNPASGIDREAATSYCRWAGLTKALPVVIRNRFVYPLGSGKFVCMSPAGTDFDP